MTRTADMTAPEPTDVSPERAKILVASAAIADASMIARLLGEEFSQVFTSCSSEHSAEEFERCAPDVLVLAFRSIEDAESYYLGLYRRGDRVASIPHRTVILCAKDDLKRAYQLCRRQYFDDYVLFWPVTYDAPRLFMSVHHALQRKFGTSTAQSADLGQLIRRIRELEQLLATQIPEGAARIKAVNASLSEAAADAAGALEGWSQRIAALGDTVSAGTDLDNELRALKGAVVEAPLDRIRDSLEPVRQWADDLAPAIEDRLSAVRDLDSRVAKKEVTVLFVDDDEFQHRLVAHLLKGHGIQLICATNGETALSLLRNTSPDLMLVDLNLAEMSGAELVRKIRRAPLYSKTPIIMVTGASKKGNVLECLQSGATDFLVKPIDRERLLGKVLRHANALTAAPST